MIRITDFSTMDSNTPSRISENHLSIHTRTNKWIVTDLINEPAPMAVIFVILKIVVFIEFLSDGFVVDTSKVPNPLPLGNNWDNTVSEKKTLLFCQPKVNTGGRPP